MKVWAFTIVKNAIKYDYPILESIQSVLPLCDHMIVMHGDSDDGTSDLLNSLSSTKLIIESSTWDPSLKKGGKVLATETNKAYNLIPNDVDWCIYLQADEIIHENDIPLINKSMSEHQLNPEVKGLLFNYHHFYGSYDYIGISSQWYKKEIRIIRRDPSIYSYKDAQGFRMNDNQKLAVKETGAFIHHYGYVKDPETMQKKLKEFHQLWHDKEEIKRYTGDEESFDFKKIDVLKKFDGIHPEMMNKRIKEKKWQFDYDLSTNNYSIKDRLKIWLAKWTGKSLGEYRNYRII